mmetsp:Transcript_19338/g.40662  ORF Transcript_19338/g.40662 Transcript_19338/m.40662 type:complete len:535 (-) Transcript_19338:1106-2710(-)
MVRLAILAGAGVGPWTHHGCLGRAPAHHQLSDLLGQDPLPHGVRELQGAFQRLLEVEHGGELERLLQLVALDGRLNQLEQAAVHLQLHLDAGRLAQLALQVLVLQRGGAVRDDGNRQRHGGDDGPGLHLWHVPRRLGDDAKDLPLGQPHYVVVLSLGLARVPRVEEGRPRPAKGLEEEAPDAPLVVAGGQDAVLGEADPLELRPGGQRHRALRDLGLRAHVVQGKGQLLGVGGGVLGLLLGAIVAAAGPRGLPVVVDERQPGLVRGQGDHLPRQRKHRLRVARQRVDAKVLVGGGGGKGGADGDRLHLLPLRESAGPLRARGPALKGPVHEHARGLLTLLWTGQNSAPGAQGSQLESVVVSERGDARGAGGDVVENDLDAVEVGAPRGGDVAVHVVSQEPPLAAGHARRRPWLHRRLHLRQVSSRQGQGRPTSGAMAPGGVAGVRGGAPEATVVLAALPAVLAVGLDDAAAALLPLLEPGQVLSPRGGAIVALAGLALRHRRLGRLLTHEEGLREGLGVDGVLPVREIPLLVRQ